MWCSLFSPRCYYRVAGSQKDHIGNYSSKWTTLEERDSRPPPWGVWHDQTLKQESIRRVGTLYQRQRGGALEGEWWIFFFILLVSITSTVKSRGKWMHEYPLAGLLVVSLVSPLFLQFRTLCLGMMLPMVAVIFPYQITKLRLWQAHRPTWSNQSLTGTLCPGDFRLGRVYNQN